MYQERKEYRKKFTSSGQLHMAGETLEFMSHDVSVKGIMIEVKPGKLLANFADFETYMKENSQAEIFVENLMLTGEVEVIWLRQQNQKILMGLEFHDVIYNADRLWIKRQFYRKEQLFHGYLILKNNRVEFEGKNVSIDGLMIFLKAEDQDVKEQVVVKLFAESLNIKALAKICWVKPDTEKGGLYVGLRYLSSE